MAPKRAKPPAKAQSPAKRNKTSETQKKSIRSNYSSTIKVLVSRGDSQESFTIHEDCFCTRSAFFKAAVSNGWKEAEDRIVSLLEHHSIVFKSYLEAVYSRDLDLLILAKEYADDIVNDDEDEFETHHQFRNMQKTGHALVKLYILGDFLGDAAFKNEVVKAVLSGYKTKLLCFLTSAMRLTFEETQSKCGLQRLVADIVARRLDSVATVDWLAHVSSDSVVAVMKATISKRQESSNPAQWDVDHYLEFERSLE